MGQANKYEAPVLEAPVKHESETASECDMYIHSNHRMNLYQMLMDMFSGLRSISKEEGDMLLDLHQSIAEVLPVSKT